MIVRISPMLVSFWQFEIHFAKFTKYLSLDSVILVAKFTCLGSTGIKLIPTTFIEITYCPEPGNL